MGCTQTKAREAERAEKPQPSEPHTAADQSTSHHHHNHNEHEKDQTSASPESQKHEHKEEEGMMTSVVEPIARKELEVKPPPVKPIPKVAPRVIPPTAA